MHADELGGTACAGSDFRNGQRGWVGGEDGLRLADLVKLGEHIFLELHILHGGLNHKVGVGKRDVIRGGGDVGKDSINGFLRQLALLHEFSVTFGEWAHGLVKAFLGSTFHNYRHLGSESLHDALSHSTCSDNTNFHISKF